MLEWLTAAGAAVTGGYGLLILPTQWLKVERVRAELGLGLRLVQVSDIHVESLRIGPERLARTIRREQPDLILLTGDFTNKLRFLPRLEPYLQALEAIGAPMYAVPGNHDYRMGRTGIQRLTELLKRFGVRMLRNEAVTLPELGLQLVGIDDFGTGHSRMRQAYTGAAQGLRTIVITHDPNLVPVLSLPYDYLMAGHLHGKQFNIPFFFRLKPKGVLPAQGIYKGLHQAKHGGRYYISKGIGQVGINARLFVRSEITVHQL